MDPRVCWLAPALLLVAGGCKRDVPAPGHPDAAASGAPVSFPPLGAAPPLEHTADGIPILVARPPPGETTGSVRWLRAGAKTLEWTSTEASDGERIWIGISEHGPDVIVRDGVVSEGVLRGLGVERYGCAAARKGEMLLSGVVDSGRTQPTETVDGRTGKRTRSLTPLEEQAVFRFDASGKLTRLALPRTMATSSECRAWLGDDGRFALAAFGFVTFDGKELREDRTFTAVRTLMGSVDGPKFCFDYCNEAEKAATNPATAELQKALSCTGSAEWVAYADWVAGSCGGRAVRLRIGQKPESLAGLPESKMLNGSRHLVFDARGDLIIGLAYGFARYVVWPVDRAALTPVRTLAAGDLLSKASPTLIVRGLAGNVPDSNTYATVLGKDVGYGTGGGTFGYNGIRHSPEAHAAATERAKKVLHSDTLVVAHEAVIDARCGSYVRSPIGWENERIFDFSPPKLPELSPLAVTKSAKCLPIDTAAALPGDPDLLLALSGGELYGAWLPPPLPLPSGRSHFGGPPGPTEPQHPKPGSGWIHLGKADSIAGEAAVPAPGTNTEIAGGSWQAGGALEIHAAGRELLLTKVGVLVIPPGTKPMAVGQLDHPRAWGALGSKLVDCGATCRVLDPGVPGDIVAVVPRTETSLILGYADGRTGVYEVPASGGDAVRADAPLLDELSALLAKRPKE